MKTTTQLATLLLPVLLLAGCSRDVPAGAESAQAAATQATARHLKRVLPKGIVPSFAYNLRRDRVELARSGQYKRVIQLEYLDIDQRQALATLTADITAAGYKAGKPKQVPGDRIRVAFKQDKQPTIAVTVGTGGKLKHPSARGLVYIILPAKAPAAEPAAPAKAD